MNDTESTPTPAMTEASAPAERKPYVAPQVETADGMLQALLGSGCTDPDPA
ncbi:MAG: hypothetical protein FJ100_15470 [Deltaproteobacteria bacterium]|nr:hypothetical protein [Deltaproteobacteria bacterium]